MHFIVELLQRMHDDSSLSLAAAASAAYAATLERHHGWFTSTAFTLALKARHWLSRTVPDPESMHGTSAEPMTASALEHRMRQVSKRVFLFPVASAHFAYTSCSYLPYH